jgi:N-methylhydantoinase B
VASSDHDVIAAEVHRKALENLTNEMAITLMRTSGSPTAVESMDFSTCLLDMRPEHLGFAAYVIAHLGSSLIGTQAIDRIAKEVEVHPGDGWLVNDPHTGGALHQGDVSVIMPTFYGDEQLGWSFVNMHVLDVGGMGISGFAPGAHDVWQEGLRFPPIRIIADGAIGREWEEFIAANVRAPGPVLNDIRSMIAANNTASRKLNEIVDEYGVERHKRFCELNKDLTEEVLRRRIESLPDGLYKATNWAEFDGHDGPSQLLEMAVEMEIEGSEMRFRYSGVPQIDGFINSTNGSMIGMTMGAVLPMLSYGDMPINGGIFRPIAIDLGDPGTIVNAVPPAPVSMSHGEVGAHATNLARDTLNQAIALTDDPVLRGHVSGRATDAFPSPALFGPNQHGGTSVLFYVDLAVGIGGPAQTINDGQDTYGFTVMAGAGLADVETHEALDPLLFLWRRLVPDSGGPGIHRGGNGMEQAWAMQYSDGAAGPAWNGVAQVPPHGFGGGMPPSAGDFHVLRGSNVGALLAEAQMPTEERLQGKVETTRNKVTHLVVSRGDVFVAHSGGGGGLGDPLLRDPAKVAVDVADRYLTRLQAEAAYGVVLDEDGEVDAEATAARRSEVMAERIGRTPERTAEMPDTVGVAVARDAGGDWTCGYCATSLGDGAGNWQQGANVVQRQRPIAEVFEPLGMRVRDRDEAPRVVLREHFCGSCGGALGVQTKTDEPDADTGPDEEMAKAAVGV